LPIDPNFQKKRKKVGKEKGMQKVPRINFVLGGIRLLRRRKREVKGDRR